MNDSYSADFNVWINQTVQLLEKQSWQEIDIERLIEEVKDLGKSEKRAIASQLTRLLMHLLKWQYQPQRRSDSGLDSITDARTQIELTMMDSPSLKQFPPVILDESYRRARRQAVKQTGMTASAFPDACPYDLDSVLEDEWLPE